MPLGMEVGLGPGDFVLDGDPGHLPKNWAQPPHQFLTNVYCGQTAGWIKIPLRMEVSLGPGDIVLDGDPTPKKGTDPNFRPMSSVAKRLYVSGYHLVQR